MEFGGFEIFYRFCGMIPKRRLSVFAGITSHVHKGHGKVLLSGTLRSRRFPLGSYYVCVFNGRTSHVLYIPGRSWAAWCPEQYTIMYDIYYHIEEMTYSLQFSGLVSNAQSVRLSKHLSVYFTRPTCHFIMIDITTLRYMQCAVVTTMGGHEVTDYPDATSASKHGCGMRCTADGWSVFCHDPSLRTCSAGPNRSRRVAPYWTGSTVAPRCPDVRCQTQEYSSEQVRAGLEWTCGTLFDRSGNLFVPGRWRCDLLRRQAAAGMHRLLRTCRLLAAAAAVFCCARWSSRWSSTMRRKDGPAGYEARVAPCLFAFQPQDWMCRFHSSRHPGAGQQRPLSNENFCEIVNPRVADPLGGGSSLRSRRSMATVQDDDECWELYHPCIHGSLHRCTCLGEVRFKKRGRASS